MNPTEQKLREALEKASRCIAAQHDGTGGYWYPEILAEIEAALAAPAGAPIDMVLYCPACHTQHIDEPAPAWSNPPHRSHLCHSCGHIWRPADVATNGVKVVKTRGKADSAAPSPGETAWQPIESAPKGRKLIVGYFNDLGNWRSVMGCYYKKGTLDANHDYIDGDEDGHAPEGWYEEAEAYSEALLRTEKPPTHWMPLPVPPGSATPTKPAETRGQNIVKSKEPLGQINSVSTALPEAPREVDELKKRVEWLERLFDFSDPEISLHHAPNDPVTKDAAIVRLSDYEQRLSSPPQRPKMTKAEALELLAREYERAMLNKSAEFIRLAGYHGTVATNLAVAAILRAANGEGK